MSFFSIRSRHTRCLSYSSSDVCSSDLCAGDASVIRGIASTGRVITSAALIMVSVFLGFVVAEDAATKMFGLGLATAIFVDATFVRMMLVPAAMKLIGNATWWIPAWLDRLLPSIHGEQEARPAIPGLAADLAPEASDTQVGV